LCGGKKEAGAMFNKCSKVKALVVKMEETGETSKLMSKGGKSFIMGAEVIFSEFFEATAMAKAHKHTSSTLVGMRMANSVKMAKIKITQKALFWS
jgi:hypothetical protein